VVEKQTDKITTSTSNNDPNMSEQDEIAERFMRLEENIRNSSDTIRSNGDIVKGTIKDVIRISSEEVPEEYPIDIQTDEALVFKIQIESDKTIPIYTNWFEGKNSLSDNSLSNLLKLHNIKETQISKLYGKNVFVVVRDGHFVLKVPKKPQKGYSRAYGIIASLVIAYISLYIGIQTSVLSISLGIIIFTFINFIILPYLIYQDTWKIKNISSWSGGPLFWSTISILPIINIFSTIIYLNQRRKEEKIK
jgi:hypothetical protein